MSDVKKVILLVEDEAIIAHGEASILTRNGFDVVIAYNGQQAIDLAIGEHPVDLILMDIDLGPGMDGTRAAELILQKRDIAILFLSSHTDAEIVERTERVRSCGYVVKDSGEAVLLVSIRMAFQLHEAYIQNRTKNLELEMANTELNVSVEKLEAANVEHIDTKKRLELLLAQRLKAELARKDTEAEIRSLFEAVPVGVILLSHRVVQRVNETLCKLYGFSEEDLVGKSIRVLYNSEEEYFNAGKMLYGEADPEKLKIIETSFRRKDGEMRDVLISVKPFSPAGGGEAGGSVCAILDITERKKAEAALDRTNSVLTALINAAPVAVVGLDVDGRVQTVWNPEAERMFGWRAEEVMGQSLPFIPAEKEEEFRRIVSSVLRGESHEALDAHGTRRDGSEIDYRVYASPVRDKQGTPTGLIAILVDDTERLQSQRALKLREAELKSLFEAMPAGIGMLTERTFERVNGTLCKMLGYTEPELVGQSTRVMYDSEEEFRRVGEELYGGSVSNEKTMVETRLRRKDGAYVDVLVCTSPFDPDAPDKWHRTAATILDVSEHKRAEERYSAIVESALDGFLLTDKDGSIRDANKAYCSMLGYSRDELLGMRLSDVEAYAATDEVASRLTSILEIGHDRYESSHRRKDAGFVDVEITARALRRGGIFFIVRDMTERNRVEVIIREREFFLHRTQEVGGIGSYSLYLGGTEPAQQTWRGSPMMDKIFGIGEDFDRTGAGWLSLIVQRDEVAEYFSKRVFTEHARFDKEYQIRRPIDGEIRWIYGLGELEFDEKGNPIQMIGTVQDITERKRTEAQHQVVLQTALEGYIVVDAGGKFLDVNDAYVHMVEYSREELLSMNVGDVDVQFTPEAVGARLEEIRKEGAARLETRHRRKDGQILDVEVTVKTFEGKPGCFFAFLRDITETKKTQRALEESLQEKDALFHELQHRVKNSLALITGIIGLESNRPENVNAKDVLTSLRGRINSLANLYALLLSSGSVATLSLDTYVRSIVDSLSKAYLDAAGAIQIEQDYDQVTVDSKNSAPWGLIINELVTNALKYAYPVGAAGKIRITLRKADGDAILTVAHNGTRLPSTFDIEHPSGLGLLMVQMMAQQLDGALTYECDDTVSFIVRGRLASEGQSKSSI